MSRPSLKLGTHSTIRFSIGNEVRFILSKIKKIREKYEKIVTKKATPDSETAVSGVFPQERRARSRKFPQGEKASGGSRGAGKRGGVRKEGKISERTGKSERLGKSGGTGSPPRRWCAILHPISPAVHPAGRRESPAPKNPLAQGAGRNNLPKTAARPARSPKKRCARPAAKRQKSPPRKQAAG